jgi:hypothetical protein
MSSAAVWKAALKGSLGAGWRRRRPHPPRPAPACWSCPLASEEPPTKSVGVRRSSCCWTSLLARRASDATTSALPSNVSAAVRSLMLGVGRVPQGALIDQQTRRQWGSDLASSFTPDPPTHSTHPLTIHSCAPRRRGPAAFLSTILHAVLALSPCPCPCPSSRRRLQHARGLLAQPPLQRRREGPTHIHPHTDRGGSPLRAVAGCGKDDGGDGHCRLTQASHACSPCPPIHTRPSVSPHLHDVQDAAPVEVPRPVKAIEAKKEVLHHGPHLGALVHHRDDALRRRGRLPSLCCNTRLVAGRRWGRPAGVRVVEAPVCVCVCVCDGGLGSSLGFPTHSVPQWVAHSYRRPIHTPHRTRSGTPHAPPSHTHAPSTGQPAVALSLWVSEVDRPTRGS